MNCKPGDMAVIVRGPVREVLGRMVTVMHAAPRGVFRLPDEFPHSPLDFKAFPDWWVCEFQTPMRVPVAPVGDSRTTVFLPVPDAVLLPIRDPGDDADIDTDAPLEKQEKETA